jgi:hypothetical protein
VTLAEVDLPDVIAWNTAFTRDHAHQVSSLHAIACADRHEEPGHSSGSTS